MKQHICNKLIEACYQWVEWTINGLNQCIICVNYASEFQICFTLKELHSNWVNIQTTQVDYPSFPIYPWISHLDSLNINISVWYLLHILRYSQPHSQVQKLPFFPLYIPLTLLSSSCQHTHHIILVLPILMLNLIYFKYTTMWEM